MADFKLRGQVELAFGSKGSVSQIAAQIRQELGAAIPINLLMNSPNRDPLQNTKKSAKEINEELDNTVKNFNNSWSRADSSVRRTRGLVKNLNAADILDMSRNLKAQQNAISSINKSSGSGYAAGITKDFNKAANEIKKTVNLFDAFVGGVSTRFAQFAKFAVASAGVQKIVQAIDYGFDALIKISDAQIKLKQVTGAADIQVQSFTSSILKLSREFGVSSTEILKGSDILAQAGFNLKEVQSLVKTIALTKLGPSFGGIEKTSEGVIAATAQFKLLKETLSGDIDATGVTKLLSRINDLSKKYAVESGNIIEAIKSAGGVFAAGEGLLDQVTGQFTSGDPRLGLDVASKFASIVTVIRSQTRLSESIIATGLRTIIQRLQDAKVNEGLKEVIGGNFDLRDAEGQFIGVYNAIKLISEEFRGVSTQSKEFAKAVDLIGGGVRQSKIAIPLIKAFAEIEDAYKTTKESTDSITRDAAIAQESLSVKLTKIGQELATFGVKIAESTGFKEFLDTVKDTIKAVTELLDLFKPTLQFGAFAGISSVLAPKALSVLGNSLPFARTVPGDRLGSNLIQPTYQGSTLQSIMNVLQNRYQPITPTVPPRRFMYGGSAFANGGLVDALLTPGEIVIPPDQVKKIGVSSLNRINNIGLSGVDSVPTSLQSGSYVLNTGTADKLRSKFDKNFSEFSFGRLGISYQNTAEYAAQNNMSKLAGTFRGRTNTLFINRAERDYGRVALHELTHALGIDKQAAGLKNYDKLYINELAAYSSRMMKSRGIDLSPEQVINITGGNLQRMSNALQQITGYKNLATEGAPIAIENSGIKLKDLYKLTSDPLQNMSSTQRLEWMSFLKKSGEKAQGDLALFEKIVGKAGPQGQLLIQNRNVVRAAMMKKLPGFSQGGEVDDIDLGYGVSMRKRITTGGIKSPISFAEGREMINLVDDKGRDAWFYRSMAGTSGKERGGWYPFGMVADLKEGAGWIVKSEIDNPGMNRPGLDLLHLKANKLLPHSDKDMDEFINKYLNRKDGGKALHDESLQRLRAKYPNLEYGNKQHMQQLVQEWKDRKINPVWGPRVSDGPWFHENRYIAGQIPKRFANGGFVGTVPGSGNSDSFRTSLMPGSYVLNKKSSNMLKSQPMRFSRGGFTPYLRYLMDFTSQSGIKNLMKAGLSKEQIEATNTSPNQVLKRRNEVSKRRRANSTKSIQQQILQQRSIIENQIDMASRAVMKSGIGAAGLKGENKSVELNKLARQRASQTPEYSSARQEISRLQGIERGRAETFDRKFPASTKSIQKQILQQRSIIQNQIDIAERDVMKSGIGAAGLKGENKSSDLNKLARQRAAKTPEYSSARQEISRLQGLERSARDKSLQKTRQARNFALGSIGTIQPSSIMARGILRENNLLPSSRSGIPPLSRNIVSESTLSQIGGSPKAGKILKSSENFSKALDKFSSSLTKTQKQGLEKYYAGLVGNATRLKANALELGRQKAMLESQGPATTSEAQKQRAELDKRYKSAAERASIAQERINPLFRRMLGKINPEALSEYRNVQQTARSTLKSTANQREFQSFLNPTLVGRYPSGTIGVEPPPLSLNKQARFDYLSTLQPKQNIYEKTRNLTAATVSQQKLTDSASKGLFNRIGVDTIGVDKLQAVGITNAAGLKDMLKTKDGVRTLTEAFPNLRKAILATANEVSKSENISQKAAKAEAKLTQVKIAGTKESNAAIKQESSTSRLRKMSVGGREMIAAAQKALASPPQRQSLGSRIGTMGADALVGTGGAIGRAVFGEKLNLSRINTDIGSLEQKLQGPLTKKQAASVEKQIENLREQKDSIKRQAQERKNQRAQRIGGAGMGLAFLGGSMAMAEDEDTATTGRIIANVGGGMAAGASMFGGPLGAVAGGLYGYMAASKDEEIRQGKKARAEMQRQSLGNMDRALASGNFADLQKNMDLFSAASVDQKRFMPTPQLSAPSQIVDMYGPNTRTSEGFTGGQQIQQPQPTILGSYGQGLAQSFRGDNLLEKTSNLAKTGLYRLYDQTLGGGLMVGKTTDDYIAEERDAEDIKQRDASNIRTRAYLDQLDIVDQSTSKRITPAMRKLEQTQKKLQTQKIRRRNEVDQGFELQKDPYFTVVDVPAQDKWVPAEFEADGKKKKGTGQWVPGETRVATSTVRLAPKKGASKQNINEAQYIRDQNRIKELETIQQQGIQETTVKTDSGAEVKTRRVVKPLSKEQQKELDTLRENVERSPVSERLKKDEQRYQELLAQEEQQKAELFKNRQVAVDIRTQKEFKNLLESEGGMSNYEAYAAEMRKADPAMKDSEILKKYMNESGQRELGQKARTKAEKAISIEEKISDNQYAYQQGTTKYREGLVNESNRASKYFGALSESNRQNITDMQDLAASRTAGTVSKFGRATPIAQILSNRVGYDNIQNGRVSASAAAEQRFNTYFGSNSTVGRASRESGAYQRLSNNFSNLVQQGTDQGLSIEEAARRALENFGEQNNLTGTGSFEQIQREFQQLIDSTISTTEEGLDSGLSSGDFQTAIDQIATPLSESVAQAAQALDELTAQQIDATNQYATQSVANRRVNYQRTSGVMQGFYEQFGAVRGDDPVRQAERRARYSRLAVEDLAGTADANTIAARRAQVQQELGATDASDPRFAALTEESVKLTEALKMLSENTDDASVAMAKIEEETRQRDAKRGQLVDLLTGGKEDRESFMRQEQARAALESGNIDYNRLTERDLGDIRGAIERQRAVDPKKAEQLEKNLINSALRPMEQGLTNAYSSGQIDLNKITAEQRGSIRRELERRAKETGKDRALNKFNERIRKQNLEVAEGGITFGGAAVSGLAETKEEDLKGREGEVNAALGNQQNAAGVIKSDENAALGDLQSILNQIANSMAGLGNLDFSKINFRPIEDAAKTIEKAANTIANASITLNVNQSVATNQEAARNDSVNNTIAMNNDKIRNLINMAMNSLARGNGFNYINI
jgi:hypothetical protein